MSVDLKKLKRLYNNAPAGVQTQSTNVQGSIDMDKLERLYKAAPEPTQRQGQNYSAPAFEVNGAAEKDSASIAQQANYERLQGLFADGAARDRLQNIDREIADILAVQGRDKSQRQQLANLVAEQKRLNEQLGNPTQWERVKLSGEALAKNIVASPFAAVNMLGQVSTDPVEMEIQALERKADQGVLDEAGWARLKELKPQQYTKALDTSGWSWQKLQEAKQAQKKASKGFDAAEQFFYDTGMSMATNIATLPANFVVPGASLALMGTQSMAGKALNVSEKGGSAGQAFGRGLASGGIEVLTEAVSLKGLANIMNSRAGREAAEGAVERLVRNGKISPMLAAAFGQSMTEGGEELTAAIANHAMDLAVGDPDASLTVEDLVLSFLGGAISGGVMGGGAEFVGRNRNTADAAETAAGAAQVQQEEENAAQVQQNVADINDGNTADKDTNVPGKNTENVIKNTENVIKNGESVINSEKIDSTGAINSAENADLQLNAKDEEREALIKQVQEAAGIDTRTEVQKVAESEQNKIDMLEKLAAEGIAPQKDVEQQRQSAAEKMAEAENRQANLDYQNLYAKYGKAPTQEQKAAAAESAFWADVERGGGEFVPPETAAKYKAFKGLVDEIEKLPVNSKAVTDEYAFSAQKGIKPIYSPVGGKQVMVNVDENNIFNLTDSEISRYMQTGKKGSTKSEKAKMAENGNNPIIANQEEFSAFIEDSIEGKRKQEIKTYGTVLDRLIKDVYIVSKGKVDLSGKFMEISSDDVKHSYDGHSQPKELGDIALSKDDYAKIAEYIRDYDDIIYVARDKTGLKIQLGKKINGYSVITEIISNERNSVRFKNMWGVSTRKYMNNPKYKSRAVANRATTQQKPAVSKFPSGDVNSTIYNIAQDAQVGNGNKMLENNGDNLPDSIGAMKSNPDSYFALANEHGTIPEGENPYRTVDVPTKSADGKTVSNFARTAMEAEATTNKFIPNMEELIAKGEMSHEVVTDKSAMQHAQHIIENNGWEDALERWNAVAKSNKAPSKNDIALGQMLYNNAVNAGDTALAQELVVDLCVQATRAGQTVQAFRLLKQMTPSGKLYMLQKTVNQINADRLDRYKGNVEDITIPQNLADNLLKAKDGEAADAAFEKIEQHIADNIPATIGDKLNAWRYLSMLGNPRTHIRNTVGNAIFSPFKTAKDIIGAHLEKAFVKDGVKTKAVVNRKTDKSLLDYAEKDFNANISAIKGEAKYGTNQHIQEMRKIFKMPLLEKLRKANTGALEAEDMLFLKHHYTKTLAGAMKANGITAANANTFENMQVMDALKTYATNEAQKATYRDVNVFSENVTRIKRKMNEAPGAQILTEGILPFAKTPANVIARGVEYSPINLVRGAFNLATGGVDFSSTESVISSFKNLVKGVKGEKYTVAEALDQLASGLTGTGICALGALLASLGLVTGKEDDGDKEGDFEKLYGVQDYAMQIGGTSMTIDWAAPAAMPFFTGVELYNAMKDDDKSSTLMSQIFKIADPVFEMSMLDGLNNAIEATAYSDSKAVISFAQAGALNYAGQFIPTLSGQFARTGNRYRTQTYVDKTKSVSPTMQRFVQQQQAKIPGLNNKLSAYRDQWGRKQDNGNVGARALQNFVSPGYWSTDKSTPVDDEIKRIYDELGEATVLPSYAAKKFNVNGETKHLTAKEYDKFAHTRGQTAYKTIEKLMTNPAYTILDTDEQAAVIEKAYGYANAKAKEAVSNYELSTQESKIDTYPAQYVIGYGAATVLKDKADIKGNKNGSTSQDEAENYLNNRNFTRQQKALLFECMCPTATTNPYK